MLERDALSTVKQMEQISVYFQRLTDSRAWAYGLFWSWNTIFLAFMVLGFAPQMLPMMLAASRAGEIPPVFLGYALALTLVPVVVVIIGLLYLRHSPRRLFALGYGVEAPLMLMLAIRFFLVREMTPAVAVLFAITGLGLAAFLWQLLDRNIEQRGTLALYLRAFGLTFLLLMGIYVSIWLTFYVIPVPIMMADVFGGALSGAGRFLQDLWRTLTTFDWRAFVALQWRLVPFWVLGILLLALTGALLVAMPVAVIVLYARGWWHSLQTLIQKMGRARSVSLVTGLGLACILLVVLVSRQPQHRAFALLENLPTSTAEAQALLKQQEAIRAGLLNAYLAPFRYVSAVGELRHISGLYEQVFKMPPQRTQVIQQIYEALYQPLLYTPVHPVERTTPSPWQQRESALRTDPAAAAQLYETFFDRSIVDGERETIVQAVRSTWSADRAQAALQVVDDRVVHLARQEISVAEHGDWAEIELYEVYHNRTANRQEVVYYFSLPESAVVTGLWLGNSPDRSQRFTYRVAPRGAAQAVYRNEVLVRNQDPALLEQIGPTQYRLRIYPIEPRRWREQGGLNAPRFEDGPPLYLWMTWRVLADDGGWPLPRLSEKRNVYWDETSVRLVNGTRVEGVGEAWLPTIVPAITPITPIPHLIRFSHGETVVARPLSQVDLPQLPSDLRLAVVLDRSRSMFDYAAEVEAALAWLADITGDVANVDVYLTASPYRGEMPTRVDLAQMEPNVIYYGGQNAAELLVQFDSLHGGERYDGVLVLTDGTGYELSADGIEVPIPDAPVWMVHMGGSFPIGYDDGTLQAIQASSGGVVGHVEDAVRRLAVGLSAAESGSPRVLQDLVDGYLWTTVPAGEAVEEIAAGDEGFAALAARWLILAEMHRQRDALDQLDTLDALHDIAIEQSIVTPYSSMIVLVEARQERLLNQLEARGDRFAREVEAVGETAEDDALAVTAVPEPEEWLLLTLVVAMLGWYVYQRRNLYSKRPGEA